MHAIGKQYNESKFSPFFFLGYLLEAIKFCFAFEQGYSEAQLKECLEEYAALNVWQIHPHTFDIRFIDA